MVKITTDRLLHYAIAVFTVVLSVLFMLLLHQSIDVTTSPFLLFLIPIIVSAWYGGLEAGVLATILTTLAIVYFFLPPFYSLLFDRTEITRIILLGLEGVLFSKIIDISQNAKRRTEVNFRNLQTKEEKLRLALDAAYMGTWDWNVHTDQVVWSETHEILFGFKPGTFNGNYQTFLDLIHHEDRPSISKAIEYSLNKKTDYKNEFRVIWPDGSIHWIAGRGKFFYDLNGKPTKMIGVVWDISERKQTEQILLDANKKINNILESITNAFVALDRDWRITYVNRETARINNQKPEEIIGKTHWEQWPWSAGTVIEEQYRRAIEQQVAVHFEVLYEPFNMWLEIHAYPSADGLSIYFQDISDRKKIEKAQKFMSEASKLLASSLDYETTLGSIVKLAVPEIADWCAIDILEENNSIQRLAVAHVDPAKVELAYELHRRYPPDLNKSQDPAINALRTGKSELVSQISDSILANSARDPEHLEILRQLNLKSYIVVPLVARGRSLGVITFVTAESKKHYQPSDLTLAEELAQCAAFAIDNARLYRDSEAARFAAQEAERRKDESLALLDSLVATAPIGFAFFDPELRCVRMNDYIAGINGIPVEESIGRTMREYLPEYADIVEPIFQQILSTGEPLLNVEISGKTRANIGEQHALANYYPVFSTDNRLLGIGVVIANITTLKKQAEALQKQQEWLEEVLNRLPTPLLFIEPETARVTFANKAADEIAGGKFPQDKPAEEYHTIYYCTDDRGNRIPDEEMPGVRVAQGERLDGFEMNWHTSGGIRRLLVFADTLPPLARSCGYLRFSFPRYC